MIHQLALLGYSLLLDYYYLCFSYYNYYDH